MSRRVSLRPVDILAGIAQRFYGDGKQEARLFEANGWRVQPDGRALTHHGVIYPGWVLRLPEATRANAKRLGTGLEGGVEKNDDGV
jgi:nucleoid-associated protein YgaU